MPDGALIEAGLVHAQTAVKKIAVLGSAPSSCALAPFDDPEWEIWVCSPAAIGQIKRCDAFFEIHRYEPEDPASWPQGYIEWLKQQTIPVYTLDNIPGVNCVPYPVDEVLKEFGNRWFTSSIAWMLALAILQKPEEIGLWGVDMSTPTEYSDQKPGCWRFIEHAESRGIKITVPPQSDLLQPGPLYGIGMNDPMWIKCRIHMRELTERAQEAQSRYEQATRDVCALEGSKSTLRWVMNTWMNRP